jgi:hypothetical protein
LFEQIAALLQDEELANLSVLICFEHGNKKDESDN